MYHFPVPSAVLEACTDKATQIHHKKGRGKFLNDESTWMPICQNCHRWAEDHKSTGREVGFILY